MYLKLLHAIGRSTHIYLFQRLNNNSRMNVDIGLCHVELKNIADEEVEMTSQATMASIIDSETISTFFTSNSNNPCY